MKEQLFTDYMERRAEIVKLVNMNRQHVINPQALADVDVQGVAPFIKHLPSAIALNNLCVPCAITIAEDSTMDVVCKKLGEYMAISGWLVNYHNCYDLYLEELGYIELTKTAKSLCGKTAHGLIKAFHGTNPTMLVAVHGHLYPIIRGVAVDNHDARMQRAKRVYMKQSELARLMA